MNEATAAHLTRLKAKIAKLQAEVDRIEAEEQGEQPRFGLLDGLLDPEVWKARNPFACEPGCYRRFKTDHGRSVHRRSCLSYRSWKAEADAELERRQAEQWAEYERWKAEEAPPGWKGGMVQYWEWKKARQP